MAQSVAILAKPHSTLRSKCGRVASERPQVQSRSVYILAHKKSLKIPLTYGKLALGFYVMATVATVNPIEGNGQRPGVPPLTGYHSQFTLFLIDRWAIRNRRKFFPVNRKSISNRPKKAVFQLTSNWKPETLLRSLLIDSIRIRIEPNSRPVNKSRVSNRQ